MNSSSVEKSIAYIEANLQNPLSLETVADAACLSKYHFSRAFKSATGDKVGDYIRRRRITQAAYDLINSTEKIGQIAIDYQFDSQESFTRSFKGVFGLTPNEYRKNGVNILAHRRSSLSAERIEHLQQNVSLEPTIITEPQRSLVGIHCQTSSVQNNVPMLWQVFMRRQHEIDNSLDNGQFGVSGYKDFDPTQFSTNTMIDKWAAIEVSAVETIPEYMVAYELSGGTYARFSHRGGKRNVQMSFEYIYSTWLPNSIYEIDNRDHFEYYPKDYKGPENLASELFIFLPIKLKNSAR